LKDASATAIYGSRAANGVVLITTRSGRMGKPQVSLNVSYGTQSLRKKIPVTNAGSGLHLPMNTGEMQEHGAMKFMTSGL
jgi:TonB-dependent SusC/RagA subfamily outer membrane receptor